MAKKKEMNLQDLLIMKLNVLYDIELAITKALPKMAKAAAHPELKKGFTDHLAETKQQVKRLEEAHKILGVKPKKLKAEGIRGIIEDGEWVMKNVQPAEALDANLVRAAQYVEHYEMAGYMSAIAWAEALGEDEIVSLLEETLGEEENTDQKLDMVGSKLDQMIL